MKVWSALFNIIAALVLLMFFAYYINISQVIDREFEEARYKYATRQATEAMFRSTIHAEDIDLDYTTLDYISIDSSEAIQIFDRVMCFNYDMSPSRENFAAINESIAACAIAGYDGFYITQMAEYDDVPNNGNPKDGFDLKFSAKIPYYIEVGSQLYAVDTYKKTYASINTDSNTSNPVLNFEGKNLPAGITDEMAASAINTQIRGRLLNEIKGSNNVSMKDFSQLRMYFPDSTTSTGVNPFGVPGIILIMHGTDFANTEGSSAMAVAGYKVIPKNNVIVFTDTKTNRSYYCYENQLKDEEKTADSGGIAIGGSYGTFRIENYYSSIQDACEAISPVTGRHYDPYYDIMVRKIEPKKFNQNN